MCDESMQDLFACNGHSCCEGACVNLRNDINNCGECGNACAGAQAFCDQGECGTPPCEAGTDCGGGLCCGTACCGEDELCCVVPGPVVDTTVCVPPTTSGTCPLGCVLCACAAPDTPIATPDGERPIASLAVGDLVYSIDGAAIKAVPVRYVAKNPVTNHEVVRVVLDTGALLEISAEHPTADGRSFGDLVAGARLDAATVREVRRVPYAHPHTYDILPASETGVYFAGGVAVASTLNP
jgi:hypothetical protein